MDGDQAGLVEAVLVVPTTMDGRIVTDLHEEEDES